MQNFADSSHDGSTPTLLHYGGSDNMEGTEDAAFSSRTFNARLRNEIGIYGN